MNEFICPGCGARLPAAPVVICLRCVDFIQVTGARITGMEK